MLKLFARRLFIIFFITCLLFGEFPFISPPLPVQAATTRQNYYAESTTQSTWNTNTTYQDKTTLTFTPDANSTYVLIASWLMNENNATYSVSGKLTRTSGTPADFNEIIYFPKDTTDYIAGGSVAIETFGASPASQTYKIQYKTSNTAGTAAIKEAKIIAIKLTSEDKNADVSTRTTTTNTAYQDKTTLTFTPDTAGDYIILGSATLDNSTITRDFLVQMTVDGTAYSTVNIESVNASNRYPWMFVKRVNLTAASHTLKIQFATENGTNTVGIAHARIVAIRADTFRNNYYAENETRATTTSASYQTYTSLTQTPLAADHLILGVEDLDDNSTTVSVYGDILQDTTSYGEMLVEAQDTTSRGHQNFTLKRATLSATSYTWYVKYRAETAGTTVGANNGRIVVLELRSPDITVGTTGTQRTNLHPGSTDEYLGGAFTFVRESGTANVTSITITQTGTVSSANLTDLILYYKQEASCSTSIPGDATQFNSTPGTFSSGSSTVTGTMAVGTSQICVYVRIDVGSGASATETIDFEISNPSTGVLVSKGTVAPATAVAISGTTTITAGSLSLSIVDASDVVVSSPSVAFANKTFNYSTQQSTGTLGVSSQKIKVGNYSASHTWTLSIAATGGNTSLWTSGGNTYDYNGSAAQGRLQVDPSAATITPGTGCSNTGLSNQSAAYFAQGTVDSINLVIAGSTGQTDCYWYVTGIGMTQDIPASQLPGSYTLSMTLTLL